MKSKITKRDLLFFFLGIMTLFIIDLVWDWENNVKAFKEGMAGASESPKTENIK